MHVDQQQQQPQQQSNIFADDDDDDDIPFSVRYPGSLFYDNVPLYSRDPGNPYFDYVPFSVGYNTAQPNKKKDKKSKAASKKTTKAKPKPKPKPKSKSKAKQSRARYNEDDDDEQPRKVRTISWDSPFWRQPQYAEELAAHEKYQASKRAPYDVEEARLAQERYVRNREARRRASEATKRAVKQAELDAYYDQEEDLSF